MDNESSKKTCSKCYEEKEIESFPKRHSGKTKRTRGTCKRCYYVCQRKYKKKNRLKNKNTNVLDLNFYKFCSKCKERKHAKQFGTSKSEKDGTTSDCATCRRNHYNKYKNTLTTRYNAIKRSARRRDLLFNISKDFFDNITKQSCVYCNDIKVFNGIDRIDSKLGYITDNCTPCCTTCNIMKWQLTKQQFIQHVRKILMFQDKENNE